MPPYGEKHKRYIICSSLHNDNLMAGNHETIDGNRSSLKDLANIVCHGRATGLFILETKALIG